jgi:hypothetical protein
MSGSGFSACAKITMSTCARLLVLLIVYGCFGAIAVADTGTASPKDEYAQGPGPYNFDCDAQADHYMQMKIRSPGGELRIAGSFRILTNRGVFHTYPFVTISLNSPASHSAVRLAALVTNGDITRFSFGRGTSLDLEFAKEAFTTTAETPFVLKIDMDGNVTGSIDDIKVPGRRNAYGFEYLKLTCSTAHVRFANVTLEPLK